jgi:hypothetical protein
VHILPDVPILNIDTVTTVGCVTLRVGFLITGHRKFFKESEHIAVLQRVRPGGGMTLNGS